MKTSMKIAAVAALVAAACSSAYAAGFQLTEQSSLGAGRAYAGAGIVGDDLSAVHYNPAGMTLLPGTQVQAGGVYIDMNLEYSGRDVYTGADVSENGRYKGQFIPAGFITHQIRDDLWLGLGLTVPYGMGTEYKDDWAHNFRGIESTILTFDINPNIAWKVNDFVSVAGGLSLQYAKANLKLGLKELSNRAANDGKIDADSWDWGFNLGVMVEPTDKLRFGLSYRSAIEHNAEGDFTLGLATGMNVVMASKATVKTPDTVMLTGTWEATEQLRLSGTIRWANWSNFETLTIKNRVPAALQGSGLSSALSEHDVQNDWEDTWLFSIGADYKINDTWTVRGGIAYEKDPIADESTRMAVIPDTDRLWLSLGATYHMNQNVQFDVGATYIRGIGDMDMYSNLESAGGKKIGEFDSLDAYLVGVQVQYRF